MAAKEQHPSRLPSVESLRSIEAAPPFINGLLHAYPDIHITHDMVQAIATKASTWDTQLFLDQMNGEVDRTRFVSEYIGRCKEKEDVQAELDTISHTVLTRLHKEPEDLQHAVFLTLNGGPGTIDSILWLDEQHGAVTKQLKAQRTKESETYRDRNIDALYPKQTFDFMSSLFRPQFSTPLEPKIQYKGIYDHNRLMSVSRIMTVAHLPEENKQILTHLTPTQFQRRPGQRDMDPTTLQGFMWHFRKAGDPFVRVTAETFRAILKKKEALKSQEDWNDALQDYLGSH